MSKWIYCFAACLLSCAITHSSLANPTTFDADPNEMARIHFCGTIKSSTDSSAASFLTVANRPASAAWREKILTNLSKAPFEIFKKQLAAGTANDFSGELRPLIVDLYQYESFIEAMSSTTQAPEWMLAIKLPKARANVWQSTLSKVLTSWTSIAPAPINGTGYSGWQLKKQHSPDTLVCLQSGEWLLFGWGDGSLSLQSILLKRLSHSGNPGTPLKEFWIEGHFNMASIMAHYPNPLLSSLFGPKPPRVDLEVKGSGTYIRPEVDLLFDHPLNVKLDPWLIPTNLIQNRFTSLMVARGVQDWLGRMPFVQSLKLPSVPNQFSSWSRSGILLEHNLAFPAQDSRTYLAKAKDGIINTINLEFIGNDSLVEADWEGNSIGLKEFPLSPFSIHPVKQMNGEYILTGLVPLGNSRVPQKLPEELLKQIFTDPKLLSYSWELTDERLNQWLNLFGLNSLARGRSGASRTDPGQKCYEQIHGDLGPCATIYTLEAPDKIKILRNATVGLSGFELALLQYWADSPSFPMAPVFPAKTIRNISGKAPFAPQPPPATAPSTPIVPIPPPRAH